MSPIAANLQTVQSHSRRVCSACGRDPAEVTLLLATKTQPPSRIIEAMAHGPLPTGENRGQELIEKAPALTGLGHGAERHWIISHACSRLQKIEPAAAHAKQCFVSKDGNSKVGFVRRLGVRLRRDFAVAANGRFDGPHCGVAIIK